MPQFLYTRTCTTNLKCGIHWTRMKSHFSIDENEVLFTRSDIGYVLGLFLFNRLYCSVKWKIIQIIVLVTVVKLALRSSPSTYVDDSPNFVASLKMNGCYRRHLPFLQEAALHHA